MRNLWVEYHKSLKASEHCVSQVSQILKINSPNGAAQDYLSWSDFDRQQSDIGSQTSSPKGHGSDGQWTSKINGRQTAAMVRQ